MSCCSPNSPRFLWWTAFIPLGNESGKIFRHHPSIFCQLKESISSRDCCSQRRNRWETNSKPLKHIMQTWGDSGRWAFSLHPISSVSFAPPSLPQKTCDLWRWQNLPNESLCLVWLFDTPVPSWHLNEWLQMFPIQSEQFSFSTPPSQM